LIAASAAFFICGDVHMQIVLNGEKTEQKEGLSIAGLLIRLGIGLDRVAVEVNLNIVSKSKYDTHLLSDGDKIEIVHFVGGG
jgi:thiamine biosynthesis protein ThiS